MASEPSMLSDVGNLTSVTVTLVMVVMRRGLLSGKSGCESAQVSYVQPPRQQRRRGGCSRNVGQSVSQSAATHWNFETLSFVTSSVPVSTLASTVLPEAASNAV